MQEAIRESQRHAGKRHENAEPLNAPHPLAFDEPVQAQRRKAGRGVQKNRHARRARQCESEKDAHELGCEQHARQQTGAERAVVAEKRRAARARPTPDQQRGDRGTQARLKKRWQRGVGAFDRHLLESPDRAQADHQQDGEAIGGAARAKCGGAHGDVVTIRARRGCPAQRVRYQTRSRVHSMTPPPTRASDKSQVICEFKDTCATPAQHLFLTVLISR